MPDIPYPSGYLANAGYTENYGISGIITQPDIRPNANKYMAYFRERERKINEEKLKNEILSKKREELDEVRTLFIGDRNPGVKECMQV